MSLTLAPAPLALTLALTLALALTLTLALTLAGAGGEPAARQGCACKYAKSLDPPLARLVLYTLPCSPRRIPPV